MQQNHKHFTQLITAFVLCVCMDGTNAFASPDSFFGDKLSERESTKIQESLGSFEKVRDSLDDIQNLLTYEELLKGNCEAFLDIEGAAKKNDHRSEWLLADLYHQGLCVKQDDKVAVQWLMKAAAGNEKKAYFDLGLFFYQGWGTDKNPAAALHWFSKAAES